MNKKKSMRRTHPLSILIFLYRFLFLLILPLLRGFLSALNGNLKEWFTGVWIDVLVLFALIVISTLKWALFQYYMDKDTIELTYGIIFRHKITLPMRSVTTLSSLSSIWLRPFWISKVRIDTAARGTRKADFSFYVRRSEAHRIMRLRQEPKQLQDSCVCRYRPPIWSIVLLSVFTSNTLPGIIMVATFVSQAGKLLGQELSMLLRHTFEETARKIAFGLPPIAAAAALFLFIGWFAAFLMNLLQTKGLEIVRTAHRLQVSGGVLTQKRYSLHVQDISFIDIRQSLITRTLRLFSVYLNAIGFGKEQQDIAAIIPFSIKSRVLSRLSLLLPEFIPTKRTIKPARGAFLKFLLLPAIVLVSIPIAAAYGMRLFPIWADIIRFVGFMAALPALWFFGVRLVDLLSSGASKQREYYTMRYSNGFYLHTVIVAWEKITVIDIRQSIFQRFSNKCDAVILTRAEGRRHHILRTLHLDDCLRMFELRETD